ncbi:MAG: DNA polymerase III subunit gamma/tau, partial [Alphaproteobacteria bacterium]
EVHMLSNQAFNGLLKTLEEPPEHVKFIFATTEIRKVPVTILSRCQRFDLRRIGADRLAALLKEVAAKEEISIDDDALAIIARSGEGSARDSLSLLDQAIAVGPEHGRNHRSVSAEDLRSMLGLAERNRVIDLFDRLMQGDAAKALAILGELYDAGADPTAVLEDIANFNHVVTRLKVTPAAADDAALTEEERDRGKTMADAISVRALSRSWQILLKGIDESRGAARPLAAAEMVLVRLAHAADLPTPDEAIAAIQGGSATGASRPTSSMPANAPSSGTFNTRSDRPSRAIASPERMPEPDPAPVADSQEDPAPPLRGLEDLVALAAEKRDLQLKFALERFVRPVRLDSNRIEVGLTSDAPKTFTSDLGARLLEWTGQRWVIIIAGDATAATLHEKRTAAREQLESDTRSDPTVAAVMARFPGAEIVDIRVKAVETNIIAGPDQLTAEESENN